MTVAAGVLDGPVTQVRAGDGVAQIVESSGMPRAQVTSLAEVRHLGHQQLLVIRAMRVVAIEAVLAYRSVFPHERPAFFGVASITEFIHRRGSDHLRLRAVMRIMTTGALHPSFADRMVAGAHRLRAHVLVAVEAGVDHPFRLQLRAIGLEGMHAVAGGAAKTLALMNAAAEIGLASSIVA